jgi:hypothetical protein
VTGGRHAADACTGSACAGSRPETAGADDLGIRGVIFSRDRAMQLHAALTSLSRQCAEAEALSIDVLYAASSPALAKQYEVLERDWRGTPLLRFHRECDFRADLLGIIGAESRPSRGSLRRAAHLLGISRGAGRSRHASDRMAPYVLFLVDDNIFYRSFSIATATRALAARPRAIGFSLRLGGNTTYCYSLDAQQRVPQVAAIGDGVLAFDWTTAECDFGYPLEVSSSIYRGPQVAQILAGLSFSNPNTLEAQFAGTARRSWAQRSPELLCFEQSVAFCNAVNKVQAVYDNRAGGEADLSADELAKRFDAGLRIDTRAFEAFTPSACHCDVPFSFVRDETATSGLDPSTPA